MRKRRERAEARTVRGADPTTETGPQPEPAVVGAGDAPADTSTRPAEQAATPSTTAGRQLHPYAQRGPRNQPRRKKRRS